MIRINGKRAKVCIDSGHGGHDPGAVGPTGLRESDVVLKLAKELMFQLDELGIDSVLTRNEDVGMSLSDRVKESKGLHAMISIHCNSHSSQAQGIETIYSDKSGPHKAIANYIQQSLMKYCKGHKDRGIKMSPSAGYPRKLFVLSAALVPTCLTEVEFISNIEQEKWLSEEDSQRQIAHALAQGIKSFLMSLPGALDGDDRLTRAVNGDDRETERHPKATMAVPNRSEMTVAKEEFLSDSGIASLLDTTVSQIKEDPKVCYPEDEFEKVDLKDVPEMIAEEKPEKKSWTSGLKRKSKRKSKS